MSLLYFIQVFVDSSSSVAFWIVSLISSTGFALAMDKVSRCLFRRLLNGIFCYFKALVMDLSGEGVNFDNLWSGQGMPFGGSLIMMALDIIIYGLLAYYMDSVIPSRFELNKTVELQQLTVIIFNRRTRNETIAVLLFQTVLLVPQEIPNEKGM